MDEDTIGLDKRTLSAVLLLFGAVFSVYMVLLSSPVSGQGGGNTTAGPDEGCPTPQVVETFSGSNSQITAPFEITGSTFRLTLEAEPVQQGEHASIFIDSVEEDTGLTVPFGNIDVNPVEGQVTETANVLEGPGSFRLEIEANNTRYEVIVEDCTGSNGDDEVTTNQDDDEVTTNQDDDEITVDNQPRREQPRREIINIPDKPLPPTGGWPVYATVTAFVLVGAGLLGLGIGISRRGPRR
jgi:hypothetical protein